MRVSSFAGAVFAAGAILSVSALADDAAKQPASQASDAAKQAVAQATEAAKKAQVVVGKVAVSSKTKEVTLITDRNGMIVIPEKAAAAFSKYDGKTVRVRCLVGADGKLTPDQVVEELKSVKTDEKKK